MADHEDYLPGEAPQTHATSHQDHGTDEISLTGLAGEPLTLTIHKALSTVHHTKYTDAEVRAAAFVQAAILGTL